MVVACVLTCDYRYYLVNDDQMEMIDETEAYCWACHQFVASERIRNPKQCAAEIRWFKSLQSHERDKWEFIYGSLPALIERNRVEIQRWRSRKSPPRCLECGSTNILQCTIDQNGHNTGRLMHPGYLPQGLNVEPYAFASTASFYRLFNLEGEELDLLAEEIVDTVNRCHGRRVCCMNKDGGFFYGKSFDDA
jgi:hypothetical protein